MEGNLQRRQFHTAGHINRKQQRSPCRLCSDLAQSDDRILTAVACGFSRYFGVKLPLGASSRDSNESSKLRWCRGRRGE
jgi:hypothetical protein